MSCIHLRSTAANVKALKGTQHTSISLKIVTKVHCLLLQLIMTLCFDAVRRIMVLLAQPCGIAVLPPDGVATRCTQHLAAT